MSYPPEIPPPYGSSDIAAFGAHFSEFKSRAFRLEVLPRYTVDEERSVFEKYKLGLARPKDLNAEWLAILDMARASGKTFSRTRILLGPMTEYLRFEIDWGYPLSLEHGEIINFVPAADAMALAFDVPILKDFWLFDERDCYLMEYDVIGQFLGVTQITQVDFVRKYVDLAKLLQNQGFDLSHIGRKIGRS
jgi:hypothetical protein